MKTRAVAGRRTEIPRWGVAGSVHRAGGAGWVVVAVLLATAAAMACRGPASEDAVETGEEVAPRGTAVAPEVRRRAGLDVILITVDTLRTDALGSYGRAGAATPWMDRLAAEGVRFETAHAHNVLTLPSHANILSGRHPQEHGVRDNSGFRFPDEVPLLAQVLAESGYRTGAFVSAFPLDSRFGLARGFEVYEDSFVDTAGRPAFLEQERPGPETVRLAREWLERDDPRPSFLWLHLYEPHFPYAPPEPWASRFASEPYQGDVAAADAALGELLGPVLAEEAGALIVLTSDHGESLGEHGEATHGIFAYEGVLRVPLILHQPELFAPAVVTSPARHVDLMPTILDALTLPVPEGTSGRSLLAVASGRPEPDPREVYFEALSGQLNRGWAPLYGLIREGWKYIDLPIPELYDLASDPREANNRAGAHPELVAAARRALESYQTADVSRPAEESGEVRRRLAALGYVSGATAETAGPWTEDDDPKRLIEIDARLREVVTRYESGDRAGALAECERLARRRPGMRVIQLYLAQLYREAGNFDRAIDALGAALELRPEDPEALAVLASTLTQAGRAEDAVALTRGAADLEVVLTRSLALARLGRTEDALAAVRKAVEADPGNPKVDVYRGTVELMAGRPGPARRAFERALEKHPGTASASSALALMDLEEGRLEASVARWRDAVAADARELDKLFAAGRGLSSAGRTRQARALLELYLELAPSPGTDPRATEARRLLAAS